jgi:hypothetical protein
MGKKGNEAMGEVGSTKNCLPYVFHMKYNNKKIMRWRYGKDGDDKRTNGNRTENRG